MDYYKVISLNGNRKLQNACKKAGFKTFNPKGKWNGYGYEKLPLSIEIFSESSMIKYNEIITTLCGVTANKTKTKTEEEKIVDWSNRLSKITGITQEEALEIAKEKLDYKYEQIEALEIRQSERQSKEREKLINKISRENPLRRISNAEHAQAILLAHHRHAHTNYEDALEYARHLSESGEINKGETKDWARVNKREFCL